MESLKWKIYPNSVITTNGQFLAIERPPTHCPSSTLTQDELPIVPAESLFSPPSLPDDKMHSSTANPMDPLGLPVRRHLFLIWKDDIRYLFIYDSVPADFLISFTRAPQIPLKATLSISQTLVHMLAMFYGLFSLTTFFCAQDIAKHTFNFQ